MSGSKPERGTFEHTAWMTDDIRAVAKFLECDGSKLSRDEYLGITEEGTRRDCDIYGWQNIRNLAFPDSQKAKSFKGPLTSDDVPLDPVPDGFEVFRTTSTLDQNGDITQQSLKSRPVMVEGTIIEQPEDHIIQGLSTLSTGDGKTLLQWVKTKKEADSNEEKLADMLCRINEFVKPKDHSIPPPEDGGSLASDLLAVYPMGDPHIGMLSWAPETGNNFDLKTAQSITQNAIDELVTRGSPTEEALIINLGDFFHSDNASNRTARSGATLDVDGRWARVLRVGIDLMCYTIDSTLTRHKRVRVMSEIGNHDDHSSIVLATALELYYRNEPRVFIDSSPTAYHMYKFGKCLVASTHGHQLRGAKLPLFMASHWPDDWGTTKHRFWYVGHIHHKDTKEYNGCTVEHFNTLAGKDAYHAAHGYDSARNMHRIVLHKEWGEISRQIVSADFLENKYKAESSK